MTLDSFLEKRAGHGVLKKALKGRNDFRFNLESLLPYESKVKVFEWLDRELGDAGIKWFAYTIRAHARSDGPLRVHVTHRGDSLTHEKGKEPHATYGAPLESLPNSPFYVHKRIDPRLLVDGYDPTERNDYLDGNNG